MRSPVDIRAFKAEMSFLSFQTRKHIPGSEMKDKILCFACAVKNIERTFNTYYELQDHLYKEHDMKRDPAMDIFNKYRSAGSQNSPA